MPRKRKDTFFSDMARDAVNRTLVAMSKAGEVEINFGDFPQFQVYPCKDPSLGDISCDLACVLTPRQPVEVKRAMADRVIGHLKQAWANCPFSEITQSHQGVIHFRIPQQATKRG